MTNGILAQSGGERVRAQLERSAAIPPPTLSGENGQSASRISGLLDGYTPEKQVAEVRDVTVRTLRAERQRRDGPPWVRVGNKIFYPDQGFRDWLKAIEHRPVRTGRAG